MGLHPNWALLTFNWSLQSHKAKHPFFTILRCLSLYSRWSSERHMSKKYFEAPHKYLSCILTRYRYFHHLAVKQSSTNSAVNSTNSVLTIVEMASNGVRVIESRQCWSRPFCPSSLYPPSDRESHSYPVPVAPCIHPANPTTRHILGTKGQSSIANPHNLLIFGLWEESRALGFLR